MVILFTFAVVKAAKLLESHLGDNQANLMWKYIFNQ
jgi:hypothetical protein